MKFDATHQVKGNKSAHARRHFTLRSNISHVKRISQIPQGIYFVEKDLCFVSKHRSFSGGEQGIRQFTSASLVNLSFSDRNSLNFGTHFTLFAKNSSPNCFFTLRPSRVRIAYYIFLYKIKRVLNVPVSLAESKGFEPSKPL